MSGVSAEWLISLGLEKQSGRWSLPLFLSTKNNTLRSSFMVGV